MAALEGMRVLDMTQYEAGTSCTQYLAWLGADVVKIEGPTGDPGRYVGVGANGADPQYFMNYNGNKRSVVLNLKTARGRQTFFDLVPHFDVFVENYGPGVLEALDIDIEELRRINPRLICARLKGFGLTGPYKDFMVYDWVAQAAAGAFSVTGDVDGPPRIVGPTYADSGTGMQAAIAVLAAYVEQQRTGHGQVIELSMQEAVTMFMRTLELEKWGLEPAGRHGYLRGRAAGGLYRCQGDGPNDWMFIYPVTTQMWDALCTTIGRPDMVNDERYCTAEARVANVDDVYAQISAWTTQHEKREAMRLLGAAGVPCSYVFDTMDLFEDEHLKERGLVQTVQHPVAGPVQLMRPAMIMPGLEPIERSPLLGEHTDEVLSEFLGLDAAALDALATEGVTRPRV
jgi:crotonobetainyl-CoA:carnitine CoA-transferase CaiB-like acyl-CoA transferase